MHHQAAAAEAAAVVEPLLLTFVLFYVVCVRVGPTGFLQSDDDAKLKIDEF